MDNDAKMGASSFAGPSSRQLPYRIPTKFELAQKSAGDNNNSNNNNNSPGLISKFARWMTRPVSATMQNVVVVNGSEELSNPKLPDEILLNIFAYLPLSHDQLVILERVSKRFQRLSQYPPLHARAFCADGWRIPPELAARIDGTIKPPAGDWTNDSFEWNSPTSSDTPNDIDGAVGTDADRSNTNTPKRMQVHWPTLQRAVLAFHRQLPEDAQHVKHFDLLGHSRAVYCLKIRGQRMITGSRDRSVRFWELGQADAIGGITTTRCVWTLPEAHARSVVALDFAFDEFDTANGTGILVTTSSDSTAKVWKITWPTDTPPSAELLKTYDDGAGPVLDALLTPTRILTSGTDGVIRSYDRRTLEPGYTMQHGDPAKGVNAMALQSPDSEVFAAVDAGGCLKKWNAETGEMLGTTTNEDRWSHVVLACVLWQGNTLVTGDTERSAKFWDADTLETSKTFEDRHSDTVRCVGVDQARNRLITGGYDGHILISKIPPGPQISRPRSYYGKVPNRKEPSDLLDIAPSKGNPAFDLHVDSGRIIAALGDGRLREIVFGAGLPYLDLLRHITRTSEAS